MKIYVVTLVKSDYYENIYIGTNAIIAQSLVNLEDVTVEVWQYGVNITDSIPPGHLFDE